MRFKSWTRLLLAVAAIMGCCTQTNAADLLAYWNFNGFAITGPAAPGASGAPTSIAANLGSGNLLISPGFDGNLDDFTGTLQNAPSGQINEDALAFLPGASLAGNGDFIELQFSMTGRTNLGVSFSSQKTSTGFNNNQWSWSTDGTNFTNFGSAIDPQLAFSIHGPIVTTALDNAANAFLRYTFDGGSSAGGNNRIDNLKLEYNAVAAPPLNGVSLPEPGDFVMGTNVNSGTQTLELVRPGDDGPEYYADPWTRPFIQAVEFDNYAGQSHNVRGNLLGIDFGPSAAVGATIYNFGTNAGSAPNGQAIGNTVASGALGHDGSLTPSRLSGLSVAPDNLKIAVVGNDSAKLIVYDYNDGDTLGANASLSGGRQTEVGSLTDQLPLATNVTHGTAWLNNNTVITMTSAGDVYEVEANLDDLGDTTLDAAYKTTVNTDGVGVGTPAAGSIFSAMAFNPEISPHLFISFSGFAGSVSQTHLYILNDPADTNTGDAFTPYEQLGYVNLTNSSQTGREIVLDEEGNLFIGGFDSTISYIPASALATPATIAAIADNSSIFYYQSPNAASSFIGLDIGFGEASEPPTLPGDFTKDGNVDAADYVMWRKDPSVGSYSDWVANFGESQPGAGGGNGAVPEPASLALIAMGLAALGFRRRGV